LNVEMWKGVKMKIAVTSQGPDLTSQVDPRFGRAKYFIVFDTDTGAFVAHDNQVNVNAVQGAGIQSAKNVAQLGVQAIITGHVGPKAFNGLAAANVSIYIGAAGTVEQAIEQFKAEELSCAANPDVEGHWT